MEMGGHRIVEPEVEAEIMGIGYWDESGGESVLFVSFVCPFCSAAGSLSLAGGGSWPVVRCEGTDRNFRVRFGAPQSAPGIVA